MHLIEKDRLRNDSLTGLFPPCHIFTQLTRKVDFFRHKYVDYHLHKSPLLVPVLNYINKSISSQCKFDSLRSRLIQRVPLATEPGWLADRCCVSQQLGALQTHSFSFLTQRTYSCSNFVVISSLVLELLRKCRVR